MRDAQRFPDGHTACTHHPGSRNLMEVRMNRTVVSGAVTACGFAVVLSAGACSDRRGNRTATGDDEQARPPVTMTRCLPKGDPGSGYNPPQVDPPPARRRTHRTPSAPAA